MRNLVLISLLASAATAVPAHAQDRGDHRGHRSDQSSSDSASDDDRPSRRPEPRPERRSEDNSSSQAQQKAERDRPVMRVRPADSGEQQQFGGGSGRNRDQSLDNAPSNSGAGDTVRNWLGTARGAADTGNVAVNEDSVRNWRGRDRRPDSPTQIQDRNLGTAPAETTVDNRSIEERNMRRVRDGTFDRSVRTTPGFGGRVGRIGTNVPREGTAPPPVTTEMARRGSTAHRWSHDWRRDTRYDWRRWRDRNRSRFHLSFYFDPFGWSYRRYNIGWQLWPSYYGQDFWLNDPWQYRLPPAYGPYRWVRYYDDALLVNIYTGTVADVIYNFFW
jgi:Ni/Co efflux regulator RcnB